MSNGKSKALVFKSILIIDDDDIFINILKTLIQKKFIDLKISVCNPKTAKLPKAEDINRNFDLLILDYNLGDGHNGLDLLAKYKSAGKFPPTIILTAEGNEDIAVKAIRRGAYDYINKQKLSIDRLVDAFQSASQSSAEEQQEVQPKVSVSNKIDFYRKLENLINAGSKENPCLMQIGIDNYNDILEKNGVLKTDKFIQDLSRIYAALLTTQKIKFEISFLGESRIGVLVYNCNKTKELATTIKKYDFSKNEKLNPDKIVSDISIGITVLAPYDSLSRLLDASNEFYVNAKNTSDKIFLDEPVTETKTDAGEKQKKPVEKLQAKKPAKSPEKTSKAEAKEPAKPEIKEKISLDLVELVKNNRIQPYYHPCIALSDVASSFEYSFFNVAGKIINPDNKIYDIGKIKKEHISKGNPGMLDRWLIRNALGQSLNLAKEDNKLNLGLLITLSNASLGDHGIHDWMEKTLTKINQKNISSSLIFEINPLDLISNKKPVMEFINDMRDKFNITFSINNIIKPDIVDVCVKMAGFEYISIIMDKEKKDLLKKIANTGKDAGVLTLMYGIEDAESLNFAVEIGVDFGQGDFIQPALDTIRVDNEIIEL